MFAKCETCGNYHDSGACPKVKKKKERVKKLSKRDYLNILRYFRGRVKELQELIDGYDKMSAALFNEKIQLEEIVKNLEKSVYDILRSEETK